MEDRTHSDAATFVRCPACGEFVVTEVDYINLTSDRQRSQWNPCHLSALLREQTIRSVSRFWLQFETDPYGPLEWNGSLTPVDLNELLTRWPRTVADRIDRTLCNLARLSPIAGHQLTVCDMESSVAFAQSSEEMEYHIKALIDYRFLELARMVGGRMVHIVVTPPGWARFEQLTRGASDPQNPVFVAMWFGGKDEKPQMDGAFQHGIQPATEDAGYRATRADLVEHNDWIMDEILGDIRLAPFVVADFTGHRNGVYLEAGFARGLGTPVIHTRRADHLDKAHFDTAQLNHVVWATPEELRKKLYHRIIGSIGMGPHSTRSGSVR